MAFTARTETYARGSSLTSPFSFTINKATGVVDGDIMFMFLMVYIATPPTVDSVPAGWTLIATNTTTNCRWYLYYKIASGEGTSYTWSLTASCRYYALNIAYSSGNFDVASISDITAISNTLYPTAGTAVRAASMSVPDANSPMVYFGAIYNTTVRTFTAPSNPAGWVEDADEGHATPDISITNGSMIWTGSGATGNMDIICSVSITTSKHAFAISLKPLSATTYTKSFTADAILQATPTKSFTADSILQASPVKSFTADAYIQQQDQVKSFTADGVLAVVAIKSFTADTILQLTNIKSFTADSILQLTGIKSFTADAIAVWPLTKSFSADAILVVPTTKQFTADAILVNVYTKSFEADAILQLTGIKSFLADAILTGGGAVTYIKSFTADAVLVTVNTKSFTTDALLQLTGIKSFDADAILNGTAIKAFTADAVLVTVAVKSFIADAHIVSCPIKAFTTDAVLFGTIAKAFLADAILIIPERVVLRTLQGSSEIINRLYGDSRITNQLTGESVISITREV